MESLAGEDAFVEGHGVRTMLLERFGDARCGCLVTRGSMYVRFSFDV